VHRPGTADRDHRPAHCDDCRREERPDAEMETVLPAKQGEDPCQGAGLSRSKQGTDPGVQQELQAGPAEEEDPATGTDGAPRGGDAVLRMIAGALGAVARFILGEPETGAEPAAVEKDPPGILTTPLAASAEMDLSKWQVTESTVSPFVKAGRLYIENDLLVIRSDLDPRGFALSLPDAAAVLDGTSCEVRFLTGDKMAGTARLSMSGKAVNFQIGDYFYTVPVARVLDVLGGRARKAAVFVERDVIEKVHGTIIN